MVTTRRDYTTEAVEAARSVLLELTRVLGAYRADIVVIGGWVPQLLLGQSGDPHVGSLDVDLALDHRALRDAGYRTIQALLEQRGYVQDARQPFIFHRQVNGVDVEVDLLAGEYEGTGRQHRTQQVQGTRPRKTRGCDLAFDAPSEIPLDGALPSGALDHAVVRVASIVSFLVMKGMALNDRLKEKDASDIYYCVRSFPGGVEALASEFAAHATHGLVEEGLAHIAAKFGSPEHVGPGQVADLLEVDDAEDRALLVRDAYERVHALLEGIDASRLSGLPSAACRPTATPSSAASPCIPGAPRSLLAPSSEPRRCTSIGPGPT